LHVGNRGRAPWRCSRAARVFRSLPREPPETASLDRVPGAICLVAAPLGLYIGSHYEPRSIHVEQGFKAGLWCVTVA
jgi:hypothetical protein